MSANKRDGSASPKAVSPARSEEVTLKIVCVGNASTGKTTFLKCWETGQPAHERSIKTTIFMEFHKREMEVLIPPMDGTNANPVSFVNATQALQQPPRQNSLMGAQSTSGAFAPDCPAGDGWDRRRAIVKVWDIQGQDKFVQMTRPYYAGAYGALVFCAVDNPESLTGAAQWKKDIDSKVFVKSATDGNEEKIPCWLVVNKCDCLDKGKLPKSWESCPPLDAFVTENGFAGWSFAAGLKGTNVSESVQAIVNKCTERFPREIMHQTSSTPGNVVRPRKNVSKKQGCCKQQ